MSFHKSRELQAELPVVGTRSGEQARLVGTNLIVRYLVTTMKSMPRPLESCSMLVTRGDSRDCRCCELFG